MTAHPVYLYTPGGSFLQTPDGRPLLMQVGYKGTPATADADATPQATAPTTPAAAAPRQVAAKAPPTFTARVN